jgi:hypothetical protein
MQETISERQQRVASALRELVKQIYIDCKGAYGAGENSYEGQYEKQIQAVSKAICTDEKEAEP